MLQLVKLRWIELLQQLVNMCCCFSVTSRFRQFLHWSFRRSLSVSASVRVFLSVLSHRELRLSLLSSRHLFRSRRWVATLSIRLRDVVWQPATVRTRHNWVRCCYILASDWNLKNILNWKLHPHNKTSERQCLSVRLSSRAMIRLTYSKNYIVISRLLSVNILLYLQTNEI